MIYAAILDMDGLMIDSEPIQSKAFEIIIREYGKDPIFHENGLIQIPGLRGEENWEEIKKSHGINENTHTLSEKRREVYKNILKENVIAKAGLIELLILLKQHKIKIAIASSSILEHIRLVVDILNIAAYFDVLVSGKDVARGKPFPDIFLKTAGQLHIDPKNCVVLEDAKSGVDAAHTAKMKIIAVPSLYTRNHNFSKADLVINSLEDISWKKIQML